VSILLLDAERQQLRVRAREGQAAWEDTSDQLAVAGLGLTAYAARTGAVVNVADVSKDPRYCRGWKRAVSELAVPLKVGARILGVVDLQSAAPAAFSESAATFVASFAERAALAIWAAEFSEEAERAYGKLQEAQTKLVKAERLAALSQLGQAIQHEIHDPLTTLMALAERTLDESRAVEPGLRQHVQVIYDMGKRMRAILQDLEKVQDNAATYIDQTIMSGPKPPADGGPDLEVEDISIKRLRSS